MLAILKTMTNELMNNGFIDRFNGPLMHHQFQEGSGAYLLHLYQSNVELQCTITKEHNSNFFPIWRVSTTLYTKIAHPQG